MNAEPMPTGPPPLRSFASDNAAGAHPLVIDAIVAANEGHALAYGEDDHTARCEQAFRELFDHDVVTRLAFNGTGSNIAALATLMGAQQGPHHGIICSSWAHINVDETGAPERVLGTKLIDVPSDDAKLTPVHIVEAAHAQGNVHHVQPGIVSITQPTELGTLYSVDEIAAICTTAHEHDMFVHLDGARIANATASLGGTTETLRAFTRDAGVDAVSFGGTKNGAVGAEAIVFFDQELARGGDYIRKQVTQLPSKMRFIAAQFNALLTDDLWLQLGTQSNRTAQLLHAGVRDIDGIAAGVAPAVNSIYPVIPTATIAPLQAWSFFWDWDLPRSQVRWMTAWDTTEADVETFVAGVTEACS